MPKVVIQRTGAKTFAYVSLALIVGPEGEEEALEIKALINTGSDHTIIRADQLRTAGIDLTQRTVRFEGATSGGYAGTAHVLLGLPGVDDAGDYAMFAISQEVGVVEDLRYEAVLGLDFLQHFDMLFARDGGVTLTWEIESETTSVVGRA